ncbi:MAG: ABC transporter ATP-binding protein/permease [Caldilineaceae bacterium]|nr:ABC transporter ATP-binding protein/permease [Caldilineaceae bacterium]
MSDLNHYEEEEFTTQFDGRTVLRILGQLKPHWLWATGFLIAAIVVALAESYFTFLSKRIIDEGIVARDTEALTGLLWQYAGLIVVQSVFVFGFIYLCGLLGERVRYDLRRAMFNHLQKLSLSYYNRTPVGWIMSRVTSDIERVSELVTWGLLDVVWSVLNIAAAVYFMMLIDVPLALIVCAIIPVIVVIAIQFQKRIITEYREVRKINSKITGAYNENITGVRVVKALDRETRNLGEFRELTGGMYRAAFRAAWLSALFLPTVQVISALAIGAIVLYSGVQFNTAAGITVGGIQAFISYVIMMVWPVQEMARVFAEMQQAIASGERIFSLLDTESEIVDRPGALDPGTLRGDIVFDHVNFYYDDEVDKPVLRDLHLRVRAGETIALVGPTGGGKSTIVNLLCRFFEPREGTITINGLDYTQMTQHAIQSRIGMVLQTPHLFSGTIAENIRYGRLDAVDEEIETAARIAGAHEFIMTLENGYETQVGEGGVLLSTGQKQLISLARAVLAQPDIFIMDEATSSVDTLTEGLIQQGMDALMGGRTSFVIAHRLSTIRNADRILVIEDGRIAEMGSHAELLRQGGHYYRLYTQQFREQKKAEYDPFAEKAKTPAESRPLSGIAAGGHTDQQPALALGD